MNMKKKRFNRAIANPIGKPSYNPAGDPARLRRFNRAIANPIGKPLWQWLRKLIGK